MAGLKMIQTFKHSRRTGASGKRKPKPVPSAPLLEFGAPVARNTDPETSHEAAKDAGKTSEIGRYLVLKNLAEGALTDFELADRTGWQQTSIGKRRGECVELGLVVVYLDMKTSEPLKRKTPSGSMARVWGLTPKGLDLLHDIRRKVNSNEQI